MKSWYLSKTLWVNCIAAVVMLLQMKFGFVIDPEAQTGLLAMINVILRVVTKQPLDWAAPAAPGGNTEAGFINLRCLVELFLVALAVMILLAGCASTRSVPTSPSANDTPQVLAGKSLLAAKSTIVVAATSVDSLCKAGTLPIATCTQAKATYEQVKPAYDAAVDAYLLMTSVGGDPASFREAIIRVQTLAADLLRLSGGAQ